MRKNHFTAKLSSAKVGIHALLQMKNARNTKAQKMCTDKILRLNKSENNNNEEDVLFHTLFSNINTKIPNHYTACEISQKVAMY